MSLLKAAMNSGTFPCTSEVPAASTSVSAAAIEVTTAITSSCASAYANTAAKPSSAIIRAVLCAIARINLNVLLGQIARPEARAAPAFALYRKSDQAFGFIQLLLQRTFRKIRRQPAPAHRYALQIDVHFRWIQRHARIPRRRYDPPPVRIGACNRRLYQRRIRDGARDTRGCLLVRRSAHLDSHQLARALAIAH